MSVLVLYLACVAPSSTCNQVGPALLFELQIIDLVGLPFSITGLLCVLSMFSSFVGRIEQCMIVHPVPIWYAGCHERLQLNRRLYLNVTSVLHM